MCGPGAGLSGVKARTTAAGVARRIPYISKITSPPCSLSDESIGTRQFVDSSIRMPLEAVVVGSQQLIETNGMVIHAVLCITTDRSMLTNFVQHFHRRLNPIAWVKSMTASIRLPVTLYMARSFFTHVLGDPYTRGNKAISCLCAPQAYHK